MRDWAGVLSHPLNTRIFICSLQVRTDVSLLTRSLADNRTDQPGSSFGESAFRRTDGGETVHALIVISLAGFSEDRRVQMRTDGCEVLVDLQVDVEGHRRERRERQGNFISGRRILSVTTTGGISLWTRFSLRILFTGAGCLGCLQAVVLPNSSSLFLVFPSFQIFENLYCNWSSFTFVFHSLTRDSRYPSATVLLFLNVVQLTHIGLYYLNLTLINHK